MLHSSPFKSLQIRFHTAHLPLPPSRPPASVVLTSALAPCTLPLSPQERATKVSHGNTARHALEYGDETLAKICGSIAADEGRHELAYQKIMDYLFEHDTDGAMLAFADMMRKQIVMPAHMMDDNVHEAQRGRNLFAVRIWRRM